MTSRRDSVAAAICAVSIFAGASTSRSLGAQGMVSGQVVLLEPRTNARHDVATAVVYLEPVGGPDRYDRPAGQPATASISMRGREFIPHVQIVRAGGSVDFPNLDPFSHNVFSNTSLGAFDLGLYRRGASRASTFARVGTYAVYCNIHSTMVSFVVAVPTRQFTRPTTAGAFALPDVPAGKYLLHVWHERTPEVSEPIDVPVGGLGSLSVSLDTRSFPATAHLNKFGQAYPPTRGDRY
jgi:plastocyanin